MPAAPRMSEEKRGKVLAYADQGFSNRAIARKLGVTHAAIGKLLQKHKKTGSVKDRNGRGRKRKTTRREDRMIVRLCLQDRRLSVPSLREAAQRETGKQLSETLIRDRLHEQGLRSCRAVKKPLLSKANQLKRFAWAKAHQHWTAEHWSRVLFTDESRFSLVSDRPMLVRRRSGERNNPELFQKTVKHGGGGVMVWGGFCATGVGELYPCEGNVKADQYLEILKGPMLRSLRNLFGRHNAIFQQDNAPVYTAKLVKGWLDQQAFTVLDWPPQSPDMNPIEHCWDAIGRKLAQRHHNSKADLLVSLREEWEALPTDYLRRLVESMPKRVHALLKAKGGSTTY